MKYLLSTLIIASSLQAIELTLTPDTNASATKKEVDMVVAEYASYNQRVNATKIKRYIEDNRALSNAYLKKHTPLPYAYKKTLQHRVEKMIADEMIKEIKESIPYDKEEVLYSYYLAHKAKRFMEPEHVTYQFIEFSSFDEATKAYNKLKDQPKSVEKYIKDNNLSVKTFERPLPSAYYMVRELIEKKDLPQLLVPQYLDTYSLIYIQKVEPPKAKPYESVKKQIEDTLFKLKFKDLRQKAIESIKKGE